MKSLTDYISRPQSVITGKNNLEPLYSFKNVPVFMGCVDFSSKEEDICADMDWSICKDTGVIQLTKLIPLEVLYLNQHNEGCGSVWLEHYESFSKFLQKYKPKNILEIGGAHGFIAQDYLDHVPGTEWTIIEPNPTVIDSHSISVIQGWFDENFKLEKEVDAVVHSHVLEHTYEPAEFIKHIAKFIKTGGKHFFSVPNMHEQLTRKYTNCLNFEHTMFITEYLVDYLLDQNGFKILEKEYFKEHSIFYATEKIENGLDANKLKNKYDEYKKLFSEFITYHEELVADLNKQIEKSDLPVYLFGAHIFSQYLIAFGLNTDKIISVLDNGTAKQGKRLYGTKFKVESPKILKEKGPVNIILKAGIYNEEIKRDILENINDRAVFW